MTVKELIEQLSKLDQTKRIGRMTIHSNILRTIRVESTTKIMPDGWLSDNSEYENELTYVIYN